MRALDAVLERLVRRKDGLVLLFAPPFESSGRDPGYIKGYPPGVRENGGQYTHAAVWTVWALAALEREGGSRGRAASIYRLLNPIHRGATAADALLYRVEPYAVAADVYGAPPHAGRGGWTWYTGSAGWMYRAGLEAILGIRRVGDRLEIDPAIPPEWLHYEVVYRYGTSTYRIHVENPDRIGGGVRSICVDEEVSTGDEGFRLVDDGATHHVRVMLGRARLGPSG
jgi:cyclic beta-1,2-glucan synthetase